MSHAVVVRRGCPGAAGGGEGRGFMGLHEHLARCFSGAAETADGRRGG